MTPSMVRTEYISVSLNTPEPVKRDGHNVTIDLGSSLKLACNNKSDFVILKALAEKAIEMFGDSEHLK